MDQISIISHAKAAARKALDTGPETQSPPPGLSNEQQEEWKRQFRAEYESLPKPVRALIPKDHTPPPDDIPQAKGYFYGTVEEIRDGWVIQSAGQDQQVAHRVEAFSEVPKVGDVLDGRYQGEKAVVKAAAQEKSQSHSSGGRSLSGRK